MGYRFCLYIITIIVLAILASAVIITLSNADIISQANDAVNDFNYAQEKEALGLAYADWVTTNKGKEFTKNNISELDYTASANYEIGVENGIPVLVSKDNMHVWSRTGDTITCTHAHDCDTTYTLGDVVDYTHTGTKESVTIKAAKTGYENDQTVTREDVSWIVIGIEDENTLLLATQKPIANPARKNLYFKGGAAYLNGVEVLNTICEELYGARSMTVDDVNNVFNFTPEGPATCDGEKIIALDNYTTKVSERDSYASIKAATTFTPDGKDIGNYVINGYNWRIKSTGLYIYDSIQEEKNTDGTYHEKGDSTVDQANVVTQLEKDMMVGPMPNYNLFMPQWLATQASKYTDKEDGVYFGIGQLFTNGTVQAVTLDCPSELALSDGTMGMTGGGIRPVVEISYSAPAKI